MLISPKHGRNVGALITSTGLLTLLVPRSVLPAIGAPMFPCATNPMLCASHRRHLLRICCTKTQRKTLPTFKKGILKKNRVYRDAKAEIPACCDFLSSPPPLSTCLQRVSTLLRGWISLFLSLPPQNDSERNVFQAECSCIVSDGLSPWVSPQNSDN